jgi:hypothetical protein
MSYLFLIPPDILTFSAGNSRRPELTQINLVDIFLFRADRQVELLHFRNVSNPSEQAGLIRAQVNDTWFGSDGDRYSPGGANQTFPFYWVIIRSDKTLDGNEVAQPIFTAVQTAMLDSVAAASSSASLASASASSLLAASLSSLSASRSAADPSASGGVQSGDVQHPGSSSSFPRWAIAVIVILGFLAIAATCILAFFILRRVRRRRTSDRDSMGSASPMINNNRDSNTTGAGAHEKGNVGAPPPMTQRYEPTASPLLPPPSIGGAAAGAFAGGSTHTHDGASTISDSGGPFSGADAAIMADAFRKMLRKPDFAAQGEGQNPRESGGGFGAEEGYEGEDSGDVEEGGDRTGVLRDQLAEEGRDLRSVGSSRGVKVELPS